MADAEADRYLHLVDPELRDAALLMRATYAELIPMNRRKLAKRRAANAAMIRPPLDRPAYAEDRARRPDGGEVAVFVIHAKPGANGAGILHIHGGGFTASTAMASLPGLQGLALELDCPIVTVDYRLAPETTWEGSLEDNYAGMQWMLANARAIGVDPARIAVLGESAGGGHAALLTLAMRERGDAPLAFQTLIYPMIDDRAGTSRPLAEHLGFYAWPPDANRFGWQSFLGRKPGGRNVPAEAVPSRASDLSGLPPAFIGVGGLDLFVEEDIEYARRLNAAGVPTELVVVPGAFHGFDAFLPDAAVSRRFAAAKVAALRRGLGL